VNSPRIRIAVFLALLGLARAASPACAGRNVYLIESRPVGTNLGNRAILDAATAWIAEIRAAKSELAFEEFYLSDLPGEPLRPVLDEIGRAAGRGVRVRLLLDARMSKTYPEPADSLGSLPNIELRRVDFGKVAGGVQHAKFFLIDRRTIVLGSQNLDWRALAHIHELGVCIHDSSVARVFQDVFELDWKLAAEPEGARDALSAAARRYPADFSVQSDGEDVGIRPSVDPRGWLPDSTQWDLDAMVRTIDSAENEIVVQTLTYSPESRGIKEPRLDDALRRAAARGVRVELLVSDWNLGHPGIDALKALIGVPNLEVRIGTVPEWSDAYIPYARVEHCKYMVVDSLFTWIGTSNWEPGYFLNSRNVAVTLKSRRLALEARKVFEASWASDIARPVRPEIEYSPKPHGAEGPPGRRVLGK
jgi:phosphatidylserine/phosphatidylglycerophosphate/cardiolipin synthase-like enzyme